MKNTTNEPHMLMVLTFSLASLVTLVWRQQYSDKALAHILVILLHFQGS